MVPRYVAVDLEEFFVLAGQLFGTNGNLRPDGEGKVRFRSASAS